MRFRNGKKKIGLIALLSCVLTATVAFAAYTGYNYINGMVTVEGSPFKMVFAESADHDALEDGGIISSNTAAEITGSAEASDIIVLAYNSAERASTIKGFNVKLKELADQVVYSFAIKNTGGATAYLSAVDIAKTTMPTDSAGAEVSGLEYSIKLIRRDSSSNDVSFTLLSSNGGAVNNKPDGSSDLGYIAVAPGETVEVELTVKATADSLFSAYNAGTETYGAEIELGQIKITWSAVDPSKPTT